MIRAGFGIIAGVRARLDPGFGVVPGAIFAASRHGNRIRPIAVYLVSHHHIVPELQCAVVVAVTAQVVLSLFPSISNALVSGRSPLPASTVSV